MGLFSRLFPRYKPITAEGEARTMMEQQIEQLAHRQTQLISAIAEAEAELTGVNEVLQALRTAVDACNPNVRLIERQISEALDANLVFPLGSDSDEDGAEDGNRNAPGGPEVPSFLVNGAR